MSLYYIENSRLRVAVDSLGAELSSIIKKDENREMLWQGDGRFWGRKSPVLFPLVGKYRGGRTSYEGREYVLGQHGFARDSEFRLLEHTEKSVSLELRDSEQSLAVYPFRFRLVCSFTLEHGTVRVGWTVENTDDKKIYFSIGAHPAFYCEKGKTVMDIENTGSTDITYNLINSEGLYTRRPHTISSSFLLEESIFDNDALIFENSGASAVSLSAEEREKYITVKFDAPLFGVWSPAKKNAPFVCIEPWYGRCDAEDFDGDITQREWGNSLEPGQLFQKEYEITVNEQQI